jgi:hypothetical protein
MCSGDSSTRPVAIGIAQSGFSPIRGLLRSLATGLLYDRSRIGLIGFATVAQLASLPDIRDG